METIGDCYVAVCGLPKARSDHAIVMANFARECLFKMHDQLMFLETSLGPDTASLGMRIGLHSGSVTAGKLFLHLYHTALSVHQKTDIVLPVLVSSTIGVLRGDRARFQL